MGEKNKIDVTIDGKSNTLVGVESVEYMQRVASYIDKKYSDIRKMDFAKGMSTQNISIIASVNVTDDYFKAILKNREYESKTSQLMQENRILKDKIEKLSIDLLKIRKNVR
ncbi:MAG: hypothetical protein A2Y22_09225 [Clostridiales bacterium GWD2_32_59]|nr:MAG: hypothetical protein A2Y22_09225 [Clostridiales bacterium GWD2_32_59]